MKEGFRKTNINSVAPSKTAQLPILYAYTTVPVPMREKHSSPIGLSISSLDMKLVKRIVINTIATSVCEPTYTIKEKQPRKAPISTK